MSRLHQPLPRLAIACALLLVMTSAVMASVAALKTELKDAEICVDAVCFPRKVTVANQPVEVLGAGLLRFWGFKVYSAAFYTPSRTAADDPLAEDKPRRLTIHYLRSVTKKDILKATEKGLEKNPDIDRDALRERFDKVADLYVDLKKGDEYSIVYEPGKGTTISLNGTPVGTIEGADFARAYFGLWVGKHALNESFRDKLVTPVAPAVEG